LNSPLEIKPVLGLSNLLFGASMAEVEKVFGKAEESELLDDIEDCQSTVWHFWENGFSLFFDESNNQLFCCVEIDNKEVVLWGQKIFSLNEKQIIELFKSKGFSVYETEVHEWGEKRISFDEVNIDFYFEKNKLSSINYGKPETDSTFLILPN
jgi:TRAP-type C4-dicarboxylate transport system substrate-binding protein